MTEEQVEELKTEVASTIRVVVNGRIIDLSEKLEKHIEEETEEIKKFFDAIDSLHERLDSQDKAIAPAIETISTLNSGRKFLLWIAPIAIVGTIIGWFK